MEAAEKRLENSREEEGVTGHRKGYIDSCDYGELARDGRTGHPKWECYAPPHYVLLSDDKPDVFACIAHLQPIIDLRLKADPSIVAIDFYSEE